MVADLKSPSLRIVFSCLGAIFPTFALFLAVHLLNEWQRASHP
jgi:hypothetical protein